MDSIRITFYLFIEKKLLIAVEYFVLQGHFTLNGDKILEKAQKYFSNWYSSHNSSFLNL